jgi:hypothetical protein
MAKCKRVIISRHSRARFTRSTLGTRLKLLRLKDPNSVVLGRSIGQGVFHRDDRVGDTEYEIVGRHVERLPGRARRHLQFHDLSGIDVPYPKRVPRAQGDAARTTDLERRRFAFTRRRLEFRRKRYPRRAALGRLGARPPGRKLPRPRPIKTLKRSRPSLADPVQGISVAR